MVPQPTSDSEKNACPRAYIQVFGLASADQSGLNRNAYPFSAPGIVDTKMARPINIKKNSIINIFFNSHAISFVKQNEDFPDLPIVLFGHSWGGYCADSVLKYHSDVKAVISCAGFNSSSDMFEFEGKQQAGEFIYLMMPFVNLHERINYGKYAENTAMDGFAATDASVMIVHSKDDDVLPPEVGYDVYYDKYKDDPRFDFILLEDKGHNCFCDDTYVNEFNAGFDDWLDTLDYDYLAEENKERFIADKADYINKNLDRKRWCNRLDTDMFERFIEFYDSNIE